MNDWVNHPCTNGKKPLSSITAQDYMSTVPPLGFLKQALLCLVEKSLMANISPSSPTT